ncbi:MULTISPECIES: glycoside hydrolase family 43 protein [unclassified Agrococcus]|uniref:glycoside hydrolase family 43 protein n=1 Tax=unclassified Agrococcus TaxID=2615065 RepID=UPI003619B629
MPTTRMRIAAVVAAALALSVAGCGTADVAPQGGEADGPAWASPVIADDFPDPDVLATDDGYYAYSTESNRRNVPVSFSEDLQRWESLGDAMPELPSWIVPGRTWAPEVTRLASGEYALYFTAHDFAASAQCIGVATAASPAGPFVVQGTGMLVCDEAQGGAIDATTVRVDDVLHLVWKNDGNAVGVDTWLQAAPLQADGLSLAGEPVRLVQQDQDWEGALVEAPTIVAHPEGLTMLYSANDYGSDDYAIGYATAPSLSGPWTKHEGPWITTASTGEHVVGPGGQDVVEGPDGEPRLVLHGWDAAFTYRSMYVAPLSWDGLEPVSELG